MNTTTRTEKRAARKAQIARIEAAKNETRKIVATGKCPVCGMALTRNLSIAGWWMCSQKGAAGFRADASKPSCDWQGFTE